MLNNIKNVKKTVMSTHLIVCILIYIFKLKNIINNKNSNISSTNENKSSKLLNIKKITNMGVDLVSKNYLGFLFHLIPYSNNIITKIKNLKNNKNEEK